MSLTPGRDIYFSYKLAPESVNEDETETRYHNNFDVMDY
jgi:hypothetical protein